MEDCTESQDLAHSERVNFFDKLRGRFTKRERIITLYLRVYGQNYSVEIHTRVKNNNSLSHKVSHTCEKGGREVGVREVMNSPVKKFGLVSRHSDTTAFKPIT